MIRKILTTAAALIGLAIPTHAEPLAKDVFGALRSANRGASQPIGFYSNGCASGNVQLPETGATWQAMRLSRNRNWGQPEMIDFIVGLSRAATKVGWRGLYVGDISQPRGGPMVSGHASHQIGLDADIWMLPPSNLRLSRAQREKISSVSVVDKRGVGLTQHWNNGHAAILKAAAQDSRVDRIFLDPVIKVKMCQMYGSGNRWLQKLRPLNGHNYHFHVRLKCPPGSGACKKQTPTVAQLSGNDNGCSQAVQWVKNRINPPKVTKRPKGKSSYRHPRSFRLSELPNQCRNVAAAR